MAYDQIQVDEIQKEIKQEQERIGNIFASVIRISQNITQVANDTIDGYATPQQGKTEILSMIKELEQNIEEIKE